MQVDGVEEELPDELENACSDDGKILNYTRHHTRAAFSHLALLVIVNC